MSYKRYKKILGVVGLVFVILVLGYLSSPAQEDSPRAQKKSESSSKWPQEQSIAYTGEGLRNPFRNPAAKQKPDGIVKPPEVKPPEAVRLDLEKFAVSGIVWGGMVDQAIINGKVVKVGDTISDVRIVRIDKEGVTIEFKNTEFKLKAPSGMSAQQKKKQRRSNK